MKIAVVGSRDYPDLEKVRRLADLLPHDAHVVSGGARGVDSAAEARAVERGLCVSSYRVQQIHWEPDRFEVQLHTWEDGEYGGYVLLEDDFEMFAEAALWRNGEIVSDAEDGVVAFWDGVSRGTGNTVARAQSAGRRVTIVRPYE